MTTLPLPLQQQQQQPRESLLSVIAKTRSDVVSNWSGIKPICHTNQIKRPSSVEEVVDIVMRSVDNKTAYVVTTISNSTNNSQEEESSSGTDATTTATAAVTYKQIRVVGGGMSYEQIFSTDSIDARETQIVIDMCNFWGLKEMRENTAVFGASTSIDDIIKILAQHNRMMNCSPGVIGLQTLAGALATGTHGQGMRQSCYADTVVSVKMVLPDGRVAVIDANSHIADPTLPPLTVAVASLGALGILVEIEIEHAPRRIFTCRKFQCTYETFLQQYASWNNKVEFVKIWWFPETDKCHVWLIDAASPAEERLFLSDEKNKNRVLVEVDMATNVELNDTVNMYLDALYVDTGVRLEDAEKHQHSLTLQRFADSKDVIGYLEQIVTKGIPVPQINCEVAVPMSLFKEATELLHAWSSRFDNDGLGGGGDKSSAASSLSSSPATLQQIRTPTSPTSASSGLSSPTQKLHYPFIYRATGEAKRTCLYPSFGTPEGVAYIGFLVYLAADGSVRQDGMAMMGELQALLARETKGLPHMGKHFIPELYTDNFAQHEGLREVARWVDKMSPNGVFLNAFLRRVFGAIKGDTETTVE